VYSKTLWADSTQSWINMINLPHAMRFVATVLHVTVSIRLAITAVIKQYTWNDTGQQKHSKYRLLFTNWYNLLYETNHALAILYCLHSSDDVHWSQWSWNKQVLLSISRDNMHVHCVPSAQKMFTSDLFLCRRQSSAICKEYLTRTRN